jgi:putative sigma-54 modulation protein
MSLNIAFRKIEATDALKAKIEKRVLKFHKYISYPMDIHVIVSLEGRLHCAEITCHAEHKTLVAMTKTKDLYESIDLSSKKIESQLKKEREKHKGHTLAHKTARPKASRLASDVGAVLPHLAKKAAK